MQSDKLIKDYHSISQKRKNFEDMKEQYSQQKENVRLIGRFVEIFDKGKELSVGKAKYKENLGNMMYSPVVDQHSINYTGRKKWLQEVDRMNKMLATRMEKPNNSVRNKDLEKQFEQSRQLKRSISKANKLTHGYDGHSRSKILNHVSSMASNASNFDLPKKLINQKGSSLKLKFDASSKILEGNLAYDFDQKSIDINQNQDELDYLQTVKERFSKIQKSTDLKKSLKLNKNFLGGKSKPSLSTR